MLGIFLDIEATGLDSRKHRILELAFKVVSLSSKEIVATYNSIVKQPESVWEQRDLNSIEVNGFSWERMQEGKEEKQVREEVIDLLCGLKIGRGKAVFICQNPSFDRAFFAQMVEPYKQEELQWPYHWLDLASMYWAIEVQTHSADRHFNYSRIPLSKDGMARSMKLKAEAKPHNAMNGVEHLLLCYHTLLKTP